MILLYQPTIIPSSENIFRTNYVGSFDSRMLFRNGPIKVNSVIKTRKVASYAQKGFKFRKNAYRIQLYEFQSSFQRNYNIRLLYSIGS